MPKVKSKVKRQKSKLQTKKRNFLDKNIIRNLLGIVFVVLGFILLYTVPTISQRAATEREPITAGYEFAKNKKESQVVRITVPKRDIDLEVKPAKIIGGYWETSEKTASHGEGTANPGAKGNVVIFAHAREGFFYNLKDVQKDDVVYVMTQDKWYRYKISEIQSVYPNKVETVAPTKNEVLTLFTCSGFFDEKRLIVKALPI